MADIFLLGSPYVRGGVIEPGKPMYRYRQDAPIAIGDTCPGKELRWIDADGLLVAQSEVLTGVSRKMLTASGLDHECILSIDGKEYKHRLIHVAPGANGEPCEWDAFQQAYPGVWMFSHNAVGFWGEEGVCFNRGGFSDRQPLESGWGWRPVLEPIIRFSPDMVGKNLFVSIGAGCLQGELVEMTNYDLVFRKAVPTNLPSEHISILPDEKLILERRIVKWIKEVAR